MKLKYSSRDAISHMAYFPELREMIACEVINYGVCPQISTYVIKVTGKRAMPIFEFVCADCGMRFEKILRRAEEAADCAHCHSRNVTRQISTFAVKSSSETRLNAGDESGPCPCGAPQRGMCSMN
ncbi:MAG TPA: zinc ribbon domain-containing protein [Acidobacteriota bacterium]|jgi:putative FmdB family regulatory protein